MINAEDDLGLAKCRHFVDDQKSSSLVVIDKSGSSPPTLEHHLAMHLWMGWLGLYALCILPALSAAGLFSILTFLRVPLPSHASTANIPTNCNHTASFTYNNSSCYSPYVNYSNPYSIPDTILANASPPLPIILGLALHTIQWIATCCCGVTFLAIIISVIAPLHKHGSPNPKWCISVGHWIMDRGAEYFKLKVVLEDFEAMKVSAESGRPAIFVLEPHDVLPVSIFSLCDYLQALPGKRRLIGCISSACFRVPLMRHVWSWVCAESIDRTNVVRLLKDGVSVCLCPGGVKEVIYMAQQQQRKQNKITKNCTKKGSNVASYVSISSSPTQDQGTMKGQSPKYSKEQSTASVNEYDVTPIIDKCHRNKSEILETECDTDEFEQEECVLYLRGRKGFVRLALQHGCPLVPMFTFGQREVLVPWFCTNRYENNCHFNEARNY